MFTGLIQAIGIIKAKTPTANGVRFGISAPELSHKLSPSDSVCVNGVCLTVEEMDADRFAVTAVGETLHRTTLKNLHVESKVNLECAVTPTTALGGHLVQGHVDCVAAVISSRKMGQDWLLSLRLPEELYAVTVPKGSIAIDGVSLTIIDRQPGNIVSITVVPYTIAHTLIGEYHTGTQVNIETDIIGKYVAQYMARIRGGAK
ncbi:MAG: riboflavin synthase [Candidatus Latescibacterota bacterium]